MDESLHCESTPTKKKQKKIQNKTEKENKNVKPEKIQFF